MKKIIIINARQCWCTWCFKKKEKRSTQAAEFACWTTETQQESSRWKENEKEKYFVEATYWRQQAKVSGNDVQVLALATGSDVTSFFPSSQAESYRRSARVFINKNNFSLLIMCAPKVSFSSDSSATLLLALADGWIDKRTSNVCWKAKHFILSSFCFLLFCFERKCTT